MYAIMVQKGAKAQIEAGDIKNCIHGLCNDGEMTAEKIQLNECGIMNYKNGSLNLNGVAVDKAETYSLANNGGKVVAKEFTSTKCYTCAVYNFSGDMELNVLSISGCRDGNVKNGGGTLTVTKGKLDKCLDKSISIGGGVAKFEDMIISGTANEKYGIYVYGGEFFMTNAQVNDIDSTAFKVDTGGRIEVKNITMKDIAQMAFRADGGTIIAENVTAEMLGGHAVYNNAEGDITLTNATMKGVDKNGIQQKSGITTFRNVEVEGIGNHGAYIALGKVVLEDVQFKNMKGNGLFLIEGDSEAVLRNSTLQDVGNHGISNMAKVSIDGLTIKNAVKNGIFNKEKGTVDANDVAVSNTGAHGVNNQNKMTLQNAKISGAGKESNCLQNRGSLVIKKVILENSNCHGVYNAGTIQGSGMTVNQVNENGVYNNAGTFAVSELKITEVGAHGINNTATMKIDNVTIHKSGKGMNAIQNTGNIRVKKATITNSGKHGLYNASVFYGEELSISDVAELSIHNNGNLEIHGLETTGTGIKAMYNQGTANVYHATIDGSKVDNVSGKTAQYLVDNNNGTLLIANATLINARGTALHIRGKANTTVQNVVVDRVGNYGVYVEKQASLSGVGLEINNVFKNEGITEAEGVAIKNYGKITKLSNVTLGTDDASITGSGVPISDTLEGFITNAIINDADDAEFTCSNLSVYNATAGSAFYNKGKANLTDVTIKNAKDGISSRYNGWVTLSGTVTIANTARNPITTYGPEEKEYSNGIEVSAGTNVVISGAGHHAVNNKGSFISAKDSNLSIQDVVGENINAINNNKGKMVLGNVSIDNIRVSISMYDSSNIITNVGNAICTTGTLQINGNTVISNIYTLPAHNKTDNAISSGVVVKNGGTVTGARNITIQGNDTKEIDGKTYQGVFNGIYTSGCVVDIDGDVLINVVKNQGIYVADANAKLDARNITVNHVKSGNGIYISNTTGQMNASGKISVSDTGARGIANTQGGDITAANIMVEDSVGDGIANGSGGIMTISGDISVASAGGCGIVNTGSMKASAFSVKKSGSVGIQNKGTINAVEVSVKNTKGIGVLLEQKATLCATTVTLEDTKGQAIQLNHSNTLDVTTMTISGTTGNGLRLYNNNANPKVTIGKLIAQDCAAFAIQAQKRITSNNLTVSELLYKNCGSGALHGNVKSGVATIKELTD